MISTKACHLPGTPAVALRVASQNANTISSPISTAVTKVSTLIVQKGPSPPTWAMRFFRWCWM